MGLANVAHAQHALAQLQQAKKTVVAGTTAATNIAITGITVDSVIMSVLQFSTGVPADLTAEASVTSNGNIQLSTTNTTGDQLVVEWLPAPDSTLL